MTAESQPVSWQPRSFQMDGVVLCVKQACAGLLYKPGLGKTSVIYMAFRILQDKGYVSKMLVICPLRPAYVVWPHQKDMFLEFQHFKVNVLHGPDKEALLHDDSADIYVVNPAGLPWLFGWDKEKNKVDKARADYVAKKFPMLVVDESAKFRDTSTRQFKIMRQIVPKFKRRYILNGSFRPKTLIDLFGQMYILDEGYSLGRYISHYRLKYFYPSGYGGYDWTPLPHAPKEIAEKIAPLVQVVEQKGNVELPELLFNNIQVILPKEIMRRYDDMELNMVADISEGKVVAANAAVASGKCRQICNGALYKEDGSWENIHDLKLDALENLIEELNGEPLLISYEFQFDMERIKKRFGFPCISTGKLAEDTRVIQEFAAGKHLAVMGQSQSVALGTDGLQNSCHNIAMVGLPWSFLYYEQLIDRVKRQGNKSSSVTVHRIIAKDTVDERVIAVLHGHDKAQSAFMKLLREARG